MRFILKGFTQEMGFRVFEARKAVVSAGFSARRLTQARLILRSSHALADSVVKGSVSLDEAVTKVEEARQQANSTEAKFTRLQTAAPALAAGAI
jgi:hypothetical protein